MKREHLAQALKYPPIWLERNLLDEKLAALQSKELAREYGGKIPEYGSEHWRFGAFLYWLRSSPSQERLQALLEAALIDPDPPMAGSVIKEILAHSAATEAMLAAALDAASCSPYFYASEPELRECFTKKIGPYGTTTKR